MSVISTTPPKSVDTFQVEEANASRPTLLRRYLNGIKSLKLWLLCLPIAFLIILPILTLAGQIIGGSGELIAHFAQTILPELLSNSLFIGVGTAIGTLILGVVPAWLVTQYRFPGRKIYSWGLVLPLAFPTYVMAYVYTDLLQYSGPVQTALRDATGWGYGDYYFPAIRSAGGAVFVFSFVLFPYVYLLARSAFVEQSQHFADAARLLGCSQKQAFWRVNIPMARPAIAAGLLLVLMEVFSDYGAVSYFGVPSFTTAIEKAWASYSSPETASLLASLLLLLILGLKLGEQKQRGAAKFATDQRKSKHVQLLPQLTGVKAGFACLFCFGVIFIGFLLPCILLLKMNFLEGDQNLGTSYSELIGNTVLLAAIAASVSVAIGLIFSFSRRLNTDPMTRSFTQLTTLGYALPGMVIGLGLLICFTAFDHGINFLTQHFFGVKVGLILTGGITALICAYSIRFMALSQQTLQSGMTRLTPSMDDAGRILGVGRFKLLQRVHVPLLRPSLLTAGLLVFVEVMKELPATLMLRPFNFETLAVRAHSLASDERLAEAATASLAIVGVGLIPIILICNSMKIHRS